MRTTRWIKIYFVQTVNKTPVRVSVPISSSMHETKNPDMRGS